MYHKNDCPHCIRLMPYINEIKDKSKKFSSELEVNTINCENCDCSALEIKTVPTLILRDGRNEITRSKGYKEWNVLVNFIGKNTNIDMKYLDMKLSTEINEINVLHERDFYSGFMGPWVIVFFDKQRDPIRKTFKDLIEKYMGRVKFGEIQKSSASNLVHRFNINKFPAILCLYDGIMAGYNG
ncbi:MAG: thioredoxin family protein [Cellulosilyticaceae bacterium]